jgi:hypothetical protein
VSDLLELNVSDDKIVRIMMVRGFTTEQVRRIIKDIRSKSGMPEALVAKQSPVSETIETGPSKRVGMLASLFGKSSGEDAMAEETLKLAEHERQLKAEESRVHDQLQAMLEKNGPPEQHTRGVPDDVVEVLRIVDSLLGKLSDEEIRRFAQSPQFAKYKAVMTRYLSDEKGEA